jgi:hypothetical protein
MQLGVRVTRARVLAADEAELHELLVPGRGFLPRPRGGFLTGDEMGDLRV